MYDFDNSMWHNNITAEWQRGLLRKTVVAFIVCPRQVILFFILGLLAYEQRLQRIQSIVLATEIRSTKDLFVILKSGLYIQQKQKIHPNLSYCITAFIRQRI